MTTTARAGSVPFDRSRRLRRRHLWLIPGLGLALVANAQATHHDLGLVPLLVFGIVPHLTVVLGIGQPHGARQLAPRVVPVFNAMHRPLLPLLALGLAGAGVLPPFWLVGALAWLSHIVVDRAMGDGPRTADGFLLGPSARDRGPNHGGPGADGDPAEPRAARYGGRATQTTGRIGPYASAVTPSSPWS